MQTYEFAANDQKLNISKSTIQKFVSKTNLSFVTVL